MFAYKENDTLFSKFSELHKIGDLLPTKSNELVCCFLLHNTRANVRSVIFYNPLAVHDTSALDQQQERISRN